MTPEQIITALTERGETLATAESLTGGLISARLTAVPGASAAMLGAVVAYDPAIKERVLRVDPELLRLRGAVDPEVAIAMARGVRITFGSTYAVASTGAAGPDPAPGGAEAPEAPAGTGYVAVSGPTGDAVRPFALDGDREAVRQGAADAALALLAEALPSEALPSEGLPSEALRESQ